MSICLIRFHSRISDFLESEETNNDKTEMKENLNKLFIFFKDFDHLSQSLLNPKDLESINK